MRGAVDPEHGGGVGDDRVLVVTPHAVHLLAREFGDALVTLRVEDDDVHFGEEQTRQRHECREGGRYCYGSDTHLCGERGCWG